MRRTTLIAPEPPDTMKTPPSPRSRRVLLVTDRPGGRVNGHAFRIANIIERLEADFDLHVLLVDVSAQGETLPPSERHATTTIRSSRASRLARFLAVFRRLPTDIHYRSRSSLRREIEQAVGGQTWDAVWCSRLRTYLLIRGLFDSRFIVDLDDLNDDLLLSVVAERSRRRSGLISWAENMWDRMDARRWTAAQQELPSEVAMQLVCKESDRQALGSSSVAVVPNSYPDPGPRPTNCNDPAGSGRSIFFAGTLGYLPNRFGLEWFIADVLPLVTARCPDVTLEVVGYVPDDMARSAPQNCHYHGPGGDVAPHLERASLVIAPLSSGGGTLLKVIEALAWGRPLVATSSGIAGFDLVDGRDALIADDAAAFGDACVRILTDPQLAAQLGENARRCYDNDIHPNACGDAATAVVAAVVDSRAAVREE